MAISDLEKNLIESLKKSDLSKYDNLNDLFNACVGIYEHNNENLGYCLKISEFIKKYADKLLFIKNDDRFSELYWRVLKFEAPMLFESFLLYMEKNRMPRKRFYQPRKRTLKVIVDDLQDLEDQKIDFLGISLPPRVGKSTICIFFLAWIIGKRPDSNNAMAGHSGILADGFYGEILNLTTSAEYTFAEIFPNVVIKSKSSAKNEVNYNTPNRFPTFTARGIDGTWTGEVNITNDGYLYVDDLVRDRTESLSPIRLENRYQDYLNVLVDRKNDGTRELMVGTRWNILDPLGKVEKENKDNLKYRFRKIPALNEEGESNFVYDYSLGFSTQYYVAIKGRLDKNEWEAKYQQRPFLREGLLFPEDSLRYYNGVLPGKGLVRKVAVCDVAWGGGDSLSMPFGYEYEDDSVFIPDWIFNQGDKDVTRPIVIGRTMDHQPSAEHFEANNGGDEYAGVVDSELQKLGVKISISFSKAPSQVSKLAKIIQYAPDIKRRFVFIDEKHRSKEYQDAMDELNMFVQIGKNEHDDAADSLSQLAAFLCGAIYAQCEAMERPF